MRKYSRKNAKKKKTQNNYNLLYCHLFLTLVMWRTLDSLEE